MDQPSVVKQKTGFFYWLFRGLQWGVFVPLVILILLAMSPYLPTKKYLTSYIITSGSMEPAIRTGSLVFVQPPADTPKVGDIVSFFSPDQSNMLVVHRIIKTNTDGGDISYRTKGDNNNSEDPWIIQKSAVQGHFLFAIPYLGYAGQFVRTKIGFALLVGIPVLFISLLQILQIRSGILEEIDKRTKAALEKSRTTIPTLLFLIFSLGMALGISSSASALFSSAATVSGITIATKDEFALCTDADDFSCNKIAKATIFVFRKDKTVSFTVHSNMPFVKISYELSYETNAGVQGVVGDTSFNPTKIYDSGAIVLGTCSTDDVCTYHENVRDFTLEGTIVFLDGAVVSFSDSKH